jgi:predicted ABC-type ATPase
MPTTDKPAGPNAYIIAGPNGAGKTTFAREFLPHYADCTNFINADLIAQGLSPFSPERAAFRAGRLVLSEIASMAERRVDFGFESTLAGRSYKGLLQELKNQGYQIQFFYLWLPRLDLVLSRIKERVAQGGHDVPEIDVRRRFERSARNFFLRYAPLSDSWMLFDNSGATPALIASMAHGSTAIMQEAGYRALIEKYGKS